MFLTLIVSATSFSSYKVTLDQERGKGPGHYMYNGNSLPATWIYSKNNAVIKPKLHFSRCLFMKQGVFVELVTFPLKISFLLTELLFL